jgi:hypothetical protein
MAGVVVMVVVVVAVAVVVVVRVVAGVMVVVVAIVAVAVVAMGARGIVVGGIGGPRRGMCRTDVLEGLRLSSWPKASPQCFMARMARSAALAVLLRLRPSSTNSRSVRLTPGVGVMCRPSALR